MTITLSNDESTTESDKEKIDNTDDSVKQEVSNISAGHIYMKWEEDQTIMKQQKDKMHVLLEDNHQLLSMISTLKMELKEVFLDFEALAKSLRMLSSGMQDLNSILKAGKTTNRYEGTEIL